MSQKTEKQEKIRYVQSLESVITDLLRSVKLAEQYHIKYQNRYAEGQRLEIVDSDISDTNKDTNDLLLIQQQLQQVVALIDTPTEEAVWNLWAKL